MYKIKNYLFFLFRNCIVGKYFIKLEFFDINWKVLLLLLWIFVGNIEINKVDIIWKINIIVKIKVKKKNEYWE